VGSNHRSPPCQGGVLPAERRDRLAAPRPGVEPGTPRSKRGMMSVSPPGRQWTAGDLHPDFRHAKPASSCWTSSPIHPVETVGIEPTSVCLQDKLAALGTCAPTIQFIQRSARGSNPVFLPTKEACRRNTCRPTARDLGVGGRQSARGPGLSLPPTTDVPPDSSRGGNRTHNRLTRLSTWPLCLFAYSAVRQSRAQVTLLACGGYEPPPGTGPPGKCQ
jgi:hypothetical protein